MRKKKIPVVSSIRRCIPLVVGVPGNRWYIDAMFTRHIFGIMMKWQHEHEEKKN
jgi:hypothetical protein